MNTLKTIKTKYDETRTNETVVPTEETTDGVTMDSAIVTDEEVKEIESVLNSSETLIEDLLFIIDNYDVGNDKISSVLLKHKEELKQIRIENQEA